MNYYERYCGDYQRDTAHLSLAEHGAYTMLLDTYFSVEKPLPEDLASLYRVCRAMTRLEQQAVKAVAGQFFPVSQDDGLRHNQRADREIAKARPKIEAARMNGRKGGRPPKGAGSGNAAGIQETRLDGLGMPGGLSTGFDHGTRGITPAASAGTHDKPGGEACQHQPQHPLQHQFQHPPQPRHQLHRQPHPCQEEASADFKPCGEETGLEHPHPYSHRDNGGDSGRSDSSDSSDRSDSSASPAAGIAASAGSAGYVAPGAPGACCHALIKQGVTGCNPHHPTLLALLQAGATAEEFVQAARNAAARGKASFPYVVGTVKRQREEAAKLVLHQGRMPNSQERLQTANRTATAGWAPPELRNAGGAEPAEPAEAAEAAETAELSDAQFAEAGGRFSSCR